MRHFSYVIYEGDHPALWRIETKSEDDLRQEHYNFIMSKKKILSFDDYLSYWLESSMAWEASKN